MDFILKRHVVIFSYIPVVLASVSFVCAFTLSNEKHQIYMLANTLAALFSTILFMLWVGLVIYSFKKSGACGALSFLGSLVLGFIGVYAAVMTGWSQM